MWPNTFIYGNLWKGYFNISWTRPKKCTAQLNQLFFVTMTTVSPQCWSITVIPHRQAFQPEPLLSFTQTGATKVLPQPSAGPLWLWQEKVQQSLFLSRVINNKAQVENVKVLNGAEEFETAWYGSLPPHIFYCSADKAIKNNDSQTSLLSKLLTLVMKICQMIMNQIRGNNLTFNWKKMSSNSNWAAIYLVPKHIINHRKLFYPAVISTKILFNF